MYLKFTLVFRALIKLLNIISNIELTYKYKQTYNKTFYKIHTLKYALYIIYIIYIIHYISFMYLKITLTFCVLIKLLNILSNNELTYKYKRTYNKTIYKIHTLQYTLYLFYIKGLYTLYYYKYTLQTFYKHPIQHILSTLIRTNTYYPQVIKILIRSTSIKTKLFLLITRINDSLLRLSVICVTIIIYCCILLKILNFYKITSFKCKMIINYNKIRFDTK